MASMFCFCGIAVKNIFLFVNAHFLFLACFEFVVSGTVLQFDETFYDLVQRKYWKMPRKKGLSMEEIQDILFDVPGDGDVSDDPDLSGEFDGDLDSESDDDNVNTRHLDMVTLDQVVYESSSTDEDDDDVEEECHRPRPPTRSLRIFRFWIWIGLFFFFFFTEMDFSMMFEHFILYLNVLFNFFVHKFIVIKSENWNLTPDFHFFPTSGLQTKKYIL